MFYHTTCQKSATKELHCIREFKNNSLGCGSNKSGNLKEVVDNSKSQITAILFVIVE